jgi:thioesterase domain-containing protein
LRALQCEIVENLAFRGKVHLLESRHEVPAEIYEARVIVGATNVPDILDVNRVAPGTILIDDSAPHCFRSDEALKRFEQRKDILVTEGGVLVAPDVLPTLVHIPPGLDPSLHANLTAMLAMSEPRHITGCVLSGLLSARFEDLPTTLGLIEPETALRHFETLTRLGFEAASLHLDDTRLDEPSIAAFRSTFGDQLDADRPRGETASVADPSNPPKPRETGWSPLVAIQPRGSQRPFFTVHPIGGHVVCYRDLAMRLGADQPLYALQAAGVDGDREPETQLETMAARYIEAIRSVEPEGPYLLGGWSFGGVVAFEMAHQLRSKGHEIALLALIDSEAPRRVFEPERRDEASLLASFVQDLVRSLGDGVLLSANELRGLESEAAWALALEHLRQHPSFPSGLGEPHVRQLWNVFQANSQAMRDYVPPVYPGRLTLFRGNEGALEPTLGWGALVSEGVTDHMIPANHYNILKGPATQILADLLGSEIKRSNVLARNS